jgi:ATP phosphoribosyltransferase regulatory subunit
MLEKAEKLVENESMDAALKELKRLMETASLHPLSKQIHINFSIVNPIDYYNGIVFQGFTSRLPQNVLFGGRYDHLLEKFDKKAQGIGFALYLNDLNRVYPVIREYDVDVLILYDESTDLGRLSEKVCEMVDSGYRVRAERFVPEDCRFRKLMRFTT